MSGIMAEKQEKEQQSKPEGRPSCYTDKYASQAYKLALLGATDKEMGDFFDVCEATINNWKHAFPEFLESIKKGKIQADANVAERLYLRAMGYEHPETKVFCSEGEIVTYDVVKFYPPDTGAAMAWLKNRQPKTWRDSHDFTTGGEKIEPRCVSFLDAMNAVQAKQEKPEEPEEPST
jgi:hypothetical protein